MWAPVRDLPDLYAVSDDGRVESLGRTILCRDGKYKTYRPKLLKPSVSPGRSHLRVVLTDLEGNKSHRDVHVLMLEAFIGARPSGREGLHWDDDPLNNVLSNLRWGTATDNRNDSVRNGRHWSASRTECTRGHLLVAPNLRSSGVKEGQRGGCLSCRRAMESLRQSGQHKNESLLQVKADRVYGQIMDLM